MLPRCFWPISAGVLLGAHVLGSAPRANAASPEEIEQKLQALQDQVNALKRQLDQAKAASPPSPPENPQFILTTRWEQVWLDGLVQEADFTGSELTSLTSENRWINRATLGLAHRPVPTVVFQAALERTWTNSGKSLAGVTNFLPARSTENTANSFLFGVAFGF